MKRPFISQLGSESGEDEGKEGGFLGRVTYCSPILRKFPLSPVVVSLQGKVDHWKSPVSSRNEPE